MADSQENKDPDSSSETSSGPDEKQNQSPAKVKEHGGPKGLEPTRYGDWEQNGRCTDF